MWISCAYLTSVGHWSWFICTGGRGWRGWQATPPSECDTCRQVACRVQARNISLIKAVEDDDLTTSGQRSHNTFHFYLLMTLVVYAHSFALIHTLITERKHVKGRKTCNANNWKHNSQFCWLLMRPLSIVFTSTFRPDYWPGIHSHTQAVESFLTAKDDPDKKIDVSLWWTELQYGWVSGWHHFYARCHGHLCGWGSNRGSIGSGSRWWWWMMVVGLWFNFGDHIESVVSGMGTFGCMHAHRSVQDIHPFTCVALIFITPTPRVV